MDIPTILDLGVKLAVMSGGGVTVYTYWKNSSLKRAEWLYQLYQKFYEEDHYKEIRRILDYDPADDLGRLRYGIENDCECQLVEALVDYLNFFEFIATLWQLKQLTLKELSMVFQYYVLELRKHDFVMEFMHNEGFRSLPALIDALSRKAKDKEGGSKV